MTRDRQLGRFGWAAAAGTALVLVLALAAPASAKKFQMSGTWLQRKGQAFIPLQFGGNNGGPNMTHVSMGSFTEAPFFPTMTVNGGMSPLAQVLKDTGVVSTMGFAGPMTPGTIMIPEGIFFQDQKAAIPLSGINLIQITSMFQNDAPYLDATFAAGGGPGSFTWCPFNAGCVAGSMLATMKPAGTMDQGRQARVIYAEGQNQFGGTMQIGVRFGGIVTVPVNAVPFFVGNAVFGGSGVTVRKLAIGGGANDVPGTETVYLARGYVTNPPMVPGPGQLINPAGPFVTVGFGNTLTMPAGVKFRLPAVPMTVNKTMIDNAQYTTNWGFPHTTGTVIVQQYTNNTGGWDRFSVMGTDDRTALGGGNLNTVAGAIGRRNQNTKVPGVVAHQPYAQFDKLFLELGFPTPSMSPAGFAAAGILMILGVGYAFRRRLG